MLQLQQPIILDSPSPEKSLNIYHDYLLNKIENIEGNIVEMGYGHGKSINCILNSMKAKKIQRDIWIYDSFEGFPMPTKEDYGSENPNKMNNLKGHFKGNYNAALNIQNLVNTKVNVIKGFFEDVLPLQYNETPIAYLHLDCDLYSSLKTCLNHLYPFVVSGGIIVLDEYLDKKDHRAFPGAKKAIDEYFADINHLCYPVNFKFPNGNLQTHAYGPRSKYFIIKE